MDTAKTKGKRHSRTRALVRGEPVVRKVLAATLEQLAHAGYRGLRIDDVAARADVNKTTIYRRWPTKEDLVRAALLSIPRDPLNITSKGSLRADLLEMARYFVTIGRSYEHRGIFRVLMAEGPHDELLSIARAVREAYLATPRALVEAARARGELAPDVDADFLVTVLGAAIHQRLLVEWQEVDEGFLVRVVDLLLMGVLAPHARETPRGRVGSRRAKG